jgi:SAM-dependent methyltransferase
MTDRRTEAADEVRRLLDATGYSIDGIRAVGVDVGLGVRSTDVAVLRRALEGDGPLVALVRLFALGEPVDQATAESTLGDGVRALVDTGLATVDEERLTPVLRLTPWRGRVVAHDPDPEGDLWPEHVSGPTPAAETLLAVVTPTGGSALDVGTGSGVLALVLAATGRRVVATDVNPAALRLTALNARLNGVDTIEPAEGSLFEPVAEDRFDVVVSNPPFVISPESDLLFRHSRSGRDEISRAVVRGAAEHLADGGFAYVMANWIHTPGRPWLSAVESWVSGTGCDALWLLHGVEDPLAYAVRWNAREAAVRPDRYPETLDRWLAHDRAEGIDAIASGIAVLRRRAGSNWISGLELSGENSGDAGPQIQAAFAGRDFLHGDGSPDGLVDRLIGSAFRIDADHRLLQTLASRGGEYVVEPARLVLDEGLALPVSIEPDLIPAILRLDGTQTVRDIARELADATGSDRATVAGRVAAIVQALVERGIASPA